MKIMFCNRILDFVTGVDIALPSPGDAGPEWDIVRPNEAAASLLASHAKALATLAIDNRRLDRAGPAAP